jgi:predicted  nucleic acid-binding Zn-ribbon protein
MKTCIACGNMVDDTIRECPNCGSYGFKKIQSKDTDPRFKKWK